MSILPEPAMNGRNLSVTSSLIIINIVVFVVGLAVQRDAILGLPAPLPDMGEKESIFMILGAYSWFTCFMEGEIWRLISYQFVHANMGHIFFNMWALYFFGPAVEAVMGPRKFLAYYLACGIAGALFSSFLAAEGLYSHLDNSLPMQMAIQEIAGMTGYEGFVLPWQMVPMVGASAAIYGVMIAVAFLYPDERISLLFPPITLKIRTFALAIIGIAAVIILFNLSNAGGEAGHLGGIIMGSVIMYIWKRIYLARRYRQ